MDGNDPSTFARRFPQEWHDKKENDTTNRKTLICFVHGARLFTQNKNRCHLPTIRKQIGPLQPLKIMPMREGESTSTRTRQRGRKRPRQSRVVAFAVPLVLPLIIGTQQPLVGAAFSGSAFTGEARCKSDNTTIGYADFDTLRNDMLVRDYLNEANNSYVLCPYTLFVVSEPLTITSNNLLLQCGNTGESSLGCILEGGLTQVTIENSPTVMIQGLTFRGAITTSVTVATNGTSSITFRDCRWEDGTGWMALWIANPIESQSRRGLQGNTTTTGSAATIVIEGSTFIGNQVDQSVVVLEAEGSSLLVQDTTFRENSAQDNLIKAEAGLLSISDSTFLENSFDGDSVISIGKLARLSDNLQNCGNTTSGNVGCEGILIEKKCQSFDSNSLCPVEDGNCHSDWTSLSRAVRTPSSNGGGYIICPGAILNLDESDPGDVPMRIQQSSTAIKCGKDGSRDDDCTVFGGEDQVVITGRVSAISFEGIKFVESTRVSIAALGSSAAAVSFMDCEWSDNTGQAAILVYNADSIPAVTDDTFASLSVPRTRSMRVDVTGCSFLDNRVTLGSIANFRGTVSLVDTIFKGNEGEAGAISIQTDGNLSLLRTCFVGNLGSLGVVFANSGSSVIRNEDNFGELNKNTDLNCGNGLNFVLDNSPCTDVDSCIGDCQVFDATECEALDMNSKIPVPTTQPSSLSSQTFMPSLSLEYIPPSHVPSSQVPRVTDSDTRTVSCSLDSRLVGYDDSKSFLTDLALSVSERYILCPGVFIDGEGLVASSVETLIIQCAGSALGCVWTADSRHLVIEGSADSALSASIRGVTFRLASQSSIEVRLFAGSIVDLQFYECVWEDNEGDATVVISDDDTQSELIGGRLLQASTTTSFEKCIFDGNRATTSLIVSTTGDLLVQHCIFQNNNAEDSLVSTTVGSAAVDSSTFDGNTFLGSKGIVFVGRNAVLTLTAVESCQRNNFGLADTTGDICDGTFLEPTVSCKSGDARPICQGTCIDMVLCDDSLTVAPIASGSPGPSFSLSLSPLPTFSPSVTPQPSTTMSPLPTASVEPTVSSAPLSFSSILPSLAIDVMSSSVPSEAPSLYPHPVTDEPSYIRPECYSDWKGLQRAVSEAGENPEEPVLLKICATTLLDAFAENLFAPIEIKGGYIKIQCGDRGRLDDNCSLYGGDNHFKISNPTENVTFTGLTFIGSQRISIIAAGNATARALFESCRWTGNNGIGAVILYNEESGEAYNNQRNLERLQPPTELSMSAIFVDCLFDYNSPSFAIIASIAGTVSISGSVFTQNVRSRVGPISSSNNSDLSVSSSCFIDNDNLIEGAVFLDASSHLSTNDGNFASGTTARFGPCGDAFHEVSGACMFDGVCNGNCISFPETMCEQLIIFQDVVSIEIPAQKPPAEIRQPQATLPSLAPAPNQLELTDAPISDPWTEPPVVPPNSVPTGSRTSDSPNPPQNEPSIGPPASIVPTELEIRPLAALDDLEEVGLYTSLFFIRTVVAAILVLWCCLGTCRCMRRRAIKTLEEEIENDLKMEKERDLEKSRKKDIKGKTKDKKTDSDIEDPKKSGSWFKLGGGKGKKANGVRDKQNSKSDDIEKFEDETEEKGGKAGRLNYKSKKSAGGSEEGKSEKKGLLGGVTKKMNGLSDKVGKKMNGISTKVAMKVAKVKAVGF